MKKYPLITDQPPAKCLCERSHDTALVQRPARAFNLAI